MALPDGLQRLLADGEQQRRTHHRGRYAPSPTGPLHLGNLQTALLSWLVSRLRGGEWLLRIDDLDTPRNRPGAEASILADLAWLGLHWDGPVIRQSQRRGLYATVLSSLRRAGALYPCRCSRRLLADVSAPHGASPVYPGFCRPLPPRWGPEDGRLPSWRLVVPPGEIRWRERLAGSGELDGERDLGDVVLRRADGFLAYHLATAVDELSLGVADVVRGADLWSATGAQVALMQRLGGEPPAYWHTPLLRDASGARLSKRQGGAGLEELLQQGLDAAAVVGCLAAGVGLVPEGSRLSAPELLQELSLEALCRSLRGGSQVNELGPDGAADSPQQA
ncbi:MAG: tRNA glutamyl-Q(34) synthetase GluQRS [Vulcanococcus sp.]